MDKRSERLKNAIVIIAILSVALAVTLCDAFVEGFDLFVSFKSHEILTFMFFVFVGCGIYSIALGFEKNSPWYFFVGGIQLFIAIMYALIASKPEYWWLWCIVGGVFLCVVAALSFVKVGNKTEDIALNKSEDYKNYKERQTEKLDSEESAQNELPKIKSFK